MGHDHAHTCRRLSAAFGVFAGLLAIGFAIAQVAGAGDLFAPGLAALATAWLAGLAIALLLGQTAVVLESLRAWRLPPPQAVVRLASLFSSITAAPRAPPPRLFLA